MRGAQPVSSLLVLLALLWPSGLFAQAPLEVTQAQQGKPLGLHMALLEDSDSSLTIEQAASLPAERYRAATSAAPGVGFTRSSYWVRLKVRNGSAQPQKWLLELAYPNIDLVELYVPQADGSLQVVRTGDTLPFAQRPVEARTFVFKLEEPAGGERTLHMRVRSEGPLNLPLVAWTEDAFQAHENRELPLMWMLYGLLCVMGAYNGFVFISVRRREYLYYSLYALGCALTIASLNGHAFQYLVPEHPWVANRIMAVVLGGTLLFASRFIIRFLSLREVLPFAYHTMHWGGFLAALLSVYSLFGSYAFSLIAQIVVGLPMNWVMFAAVIILLRRGYRPVYFFGAAWIVFMIGVLLHYLRATGIMSGGLVTDWAMQMGCALEVIVLSLALADRINVMRRDLSSLNHELEQKVSELRDALSAAEAATRAKGEFLATVSHELRTPLNMIINIPEGLLQQVEKMDIAECSACHTQFALEGGEQVTAATRCEECHTVGTLCTRQRPEYVGDSEQLVEQLGHVERSGRHLLDLVNGILDFSRLGAGRVELRPQRVPVDELLEGLVAPLRELARGGGVELVLEPVPASAELHADAIRLRQVLINLIGNAIKFSAGRGTVRVRVQEETSSLLFTVSDQGIGIPPQDLQRIFGSFEQVHQGDTRRFGGTGLGLSIAKSLVEMHGGTIWAESELGEGATFCVRLPTRRADNQNAERLETLPAQAGLAS